MSNLPPGWARATLGELGVYLNGRGFKESEWSTGGRPIIRIQNLTGSSDRFNHYSGDIQERYLVRPGDLLVSWAATLGAYVWRGPEAVLNQHIFKVRSFIDPGFHRYLIDYLLADILKQTHGSGMVHITKSRFDETPISLPPLVEQQRIVEALEAHLSRLDIAISSLRVTSSKLAALQRSALAHMWHQSASTGPPSTVAHLGRVVTGSTPSKSVPDAFGGKVPFVTPSDVRQGGEVGATARVLSERGAATVRVLEPCSVMAVCIGATLGKVGWSGAAVATNQQINGIELDQGLARPAFVAALMASPQFQRSMWHAASSTTLPILNKRKFASLWLPLPPPASQDAYISWFVALDAGRRRLDRDVDQAAERARLLRRSLLTAAFSGRLVPQDPNDEPAELLLKRIQAERATEAPRTRRTRKAKATQ